LSPDRRTGDAAAGFTDPGVLAEAVAAGGRARTAFVVGDFGAGRLVEGFLAFATATERVVRLRAGATFFFADVFFGFIETRLPMNSEVASVEGD
jgi:hypothetical protein